MDDPLGSACPRCGQELFAPGVTCPRCAAGPGPELAAEAPMVAEADERYAVIEAVGRGGMGVVYKVHDRAIDEVIAVKVLDPLFARGSAVEAFKRELKITRRIHHPNVARVFDLFVWRGRLAISMAFIDGIGLDERVAAGPLPAAAIRRYLRPICSGLAAAHHMHVVHRDLKLGNIRLDREDRPHLLDFGIAVLGGQAATEGGDQVFGTAGYMSPEQAFRPREVDHRSDIYGLGCVLYRLATGVLPFSGAQAHEIFFAHLRQPPRPPRQLAPSLPPSIEAVILRCLAKRPEDRYQDARDVYRHLEELEREVWHEQDEVPPVARRPARQAVALVVDDDPLGRAMVGDLLRAQGVNVLEAKDGYQGVELALHEKPDFILLDLVMPVLDGREALRILKSSKATAATPVIMLTGVDDPEEAMLSRATGAAHYLNKPIDPDVLELLVEKYGR